MLLDEIKEAIVDARVKAWDLGRDDEDVAVMATLPGAFWLAALTLSYEQTLDLLREFVAGKKRGHSVANVYDWPEIGDVHVWLDAEDLTQIAVMLGMTVEGPGEVWQIFDAAVEKSAFEEA